MSGRDERPNVFQRLGQVFQFRSTPAHVEREIDAELEHHFARRVDELISEGMSAADAEREAHRRFGDIEQHRSGLKTIGRKRESKERRAAWWEVSKDNLRYGLRSLRLSPGFTTTVVVTLALGIGANATMFGVVDRLLLSPPGGVTAPEDLRRVYVTRGLGAESKFTSATTTYPDFADWTAAESFTVAGFQSRPMTFGRGDAARRVRTTAASANYFELLGVAPQTGRFFSSAEDRSRAAVVVIGDYLWRNEFDSGDVLGETLVLGEAELEIIGIAPPDFAGINLQRVDAWIPLRSPARAGNPEDWEGHRNYYWLRAIARVNDNASGVDAEATALHRSGRAEVDADYDTEATVALTPLVDARGPRASTESKVAMWLTGVSGVVLLIACANVANLLLARGLRRRREIGIRLALGISRARLMTQLVTESVLLAALGGVGALTVAYWGGQIMRSVLLPNVHFPTSPINLSVLAFTSGASLVAGVVAGLVPAWQSTRPNPVDVLRSGSRGGTAQRSRTRGALLIAQAALSALLLVGAGLFVRSLNEVNGLDLGIEPRQVVLAVPEVPAQSMSTEEETRFFRDTIERLERLPTVQAVAAAGGSVPFSSSWAEQVRIPGRDRLPDIASGGPYFISATPGVFDALGLRIVEGRGFDPRADGSTAPVAVINETMARLIWPGETALGKCLMIGDAEQPPCNEVIGVVENWHRQDLVEGEQMQYFVPLGQGVVVAPDVFYVRGDPEVFASLMPAIRSEIHAQSSVVRFTNVMPYQDVIDPESRAWRLGAAMFTVFGALALVIAAVGLYGVLAFNVVQRTHELGVRTALGATPERLIGMVLTQGLSLIAVGLALGIAVALAAGSRIAPLLFNVSERDPMVMGVVVVALLTVATAAAAIPAWRAARIDPNRAFRIE